MVMRGIDYVCGLWGRDNRSERDYLVGWWLLKEFRIWNR